MLEDPRFAILQPGNMKLVDPLPLQQIRNLDTGEIFSSAFEASLSVKGDGMRIKRACEGHTKTAFGSRWAFHGIKLNLVMRSSDEQ